MLNYKLFTKPLKENLNKRPSCQYYMPRDQVPSCRPSKKWIFLISPTHCSPKEPDFLPKISMLWNSFMMMTNITHHHLSIIINIEDLSLSHHVKKMSFGLFSVNSLISELLLIPSWEMSPICPKPNPLEKTVLEENLEVEVSLTTSTEPTEKSNP